MSSPQAGESSSLVYKPITEPGSIRLAIIKPDPDARADIHCGLIHTSLSVCDYDIYDHYTALSYVWGDAADLKTVWVDGFQKKITTNLHLALRDLRDEKKRLRLWTDALCIDQSNTEEKSLQVPMMGKIYATATHNNHTYSENFCVRNVSTP